MFLGTLGTEEQLRLRLYREIAMEFEDKKNFTGDDFKDFVNEMERQDLISYWITERMTEDDYWEEARTGFNIGSHFCSVVFNDSAELRMDLTREEFVDRIIDFEVNARKLLLDIKNGNVDVGNVLELK